MMSSHKDIFMSSAADDGRVPVVAASSGQAAPSGWETVEVEPGMHVAFGCSCCVPRGKLSRTLGAMWLAAARDGRDLKGIYVSGTSPDALRAMLAADVLCAARFRQFTADLLPTLPIA